MNTNCPQNNLILGVDTHLDLHVAVLINMIGQVISTSEFETHLKGYEKLLRWCQSFGHLTQAGVEGTGTYGAGLSRFLFNNNVTINAVAESFFGSLKQERVQWRHYQTRQEAQQDILNYIAVFYNNYRLHSTLGYVSPMNYEKQLLEVKTAA